MLAREAVLPRPWSGGDDLAVHPRLAVLVRRGAGDGRTSWTQTLDAVRLGPADDTTAVTAAQLRGVVERLTSAGHWQPGDPDIVIVADAGYDVTRPAWVPAGSAGRAGRSDPR
ncbi:transposase [Streptomyces avidinii]|nr:transposase [Streptomyces avidinii]